MKLAEKAKKSLEEQVDELISLYNSAQEAVREAQR